MSRRRCGSGPQVGECDPGAFEAEPPEPADRRPLIGRGLVAVERADFEGVGERDSRELQGGLADEFEVACLEGALEACVGAPFD